MPWFKIKFKINVPIRYDIDQSFFQLIRSIYNCFFHSVFSFSKSLIFEGEVTKLSQEEVWGFGSRLLKILKKMSNSSDLTQFNDVIIKFELMVENIIIRSNERIDAMSVI